MDCITNTIINSPPYVREICLHIVFEGLIMYLLCYVRNAFQSSVLQAAINIYRYIYRNITQHDII